MVSIWLLLSEPCCPFMSSSSFAAAAWSSCWARHPEDWAEEQKKGMKKEPKEGKLPSMLTSHRRSKLSLLRGLTFRANLERPLVVLSGSARQCKLLAVNAHAFASLECKELWGNELCFSHLIAPWRLPFYFQGGKGQAFEGLLALRWSAASDTWGPKPVYEVLFCWLVS